MSARLHTPPDAGAIQRNKVCEPEGERLRRELTLWLEANDVVGIRLDTPKHSVRIDSASLPPNMKPVLTVWGSIYVEVKGEPQ